MSSMPERDGPGQWSGGTQESAPPGAPSQGAIPGQEQFGSVPGQSQGYGQQPQGGAPGQWGSQPGGMTRVNRDETKVVGRRVVQYAIDYVLAGIIPGLAYWLLDRGSGFLHGLGWLLATAIALVVYLWYWVLRPHSRNGQTFGMQLLGLRIISKDGGPANMAQYFIRAILLIIDTLVFGLVGLITMMASRFHQRVGDHAARTLVIAAHYGRSQFDDNSGGQMGMTGDSGHAQSGVGQAQMGTSQMGQQPGMGQAGMGQPGMDQPGISDTGRGTPGGIK
jgi:uncharacterized RDD family membrane protein YckC